MTMLEVVSVVVEGELEELLELFELVERLGRLERLELLFLKVFFFELVVVGSFLKLILRSATAWGPTASRHGVDNFRLFFTVDIDVSASVGSSTIKVESRLTR